jgi:ABC-type sugar transport system substrate-binding protein
LKIVATAQPEGGEAAVARTALADVFTAHPNLGSVFSVTDVVGLGAAQAINAGHSETQQASIDATEEGVNLILEEAGMNAEVAQHLEEVGKTSVNTLAEAMEGKKVPPTVYTGTTLVTAANAKEYLKTAEKEAR